MVASKFIERFIGRNELIAFIGLVTLLALVVMHDYVFLNSTYMFKDIGSDTVNGVWPYLSQMIDTIQRDGWFVKWSFSTAMGQNIFPFSLGDPFLLLLLFESKNTAVTGLAFMEFLKIILGGTIFFLALRTMRISLYPSVVGGLLYAFTGFMVLGGTWVLFSTDAVYVALMLWAFEQYFMENKWGLFPIAVALMSVKQPFYLYTYSLLILIYVPFRFITSREWNTTEFLKLLGVLVAFGALGGLMGSILMWPELHQMLNSPRVGGEASYANKLRAFPLLGTEGQMHNITAIGRFFSNDFLGTGSNFKGWYNYLEAPILYCGLISLLLFPQVFVISSRKQKIVYSVVLALCILPIIFPYFRYAFWLFAGDYYRAFSFFVAFFFIFWAVQALDGLEKENIINLPLLGGMLVLLCIFAIAPFNGSGIVNSSVQAIVIVLLLVYTLLVVIANIDSLRLVGRLALLIVLCGEVTYFSYITTTKRDTVKVSDLTQRIGYNDYTLEALAYIRSKDKNFYRIDKDYNSGPAIHASINDARVQGYYSTCSYHTFHSKAYIKFLATMGIIDPTNEFQTRWSQGLLGRSLLETLCSVNYALSNNPANAGTWIGFGFIPIHTTANITVYRNQTPMPLGFTYKKFMKESDFKRLPMRQKDKTLLQACVVGDDMAAQVSSEGGLQLFVPPPNDTTITREEVVALTAALRQDSVVYSKWGDSEMQGRIQLTETRMLFFSIPFDQGWTAYVNGKPAQLLPLNAGMMGLLLSKGSHTVELSFFPPLVKEGTIASLAGIVLYGGLLIVLGRKNRTSTKDGNNQKSTSQEPS